MTDRADTPNPPPSPAKSPRYLAPYRRAAERHGGAFGSLLWSTRHAQSVRFAALLRAAASVGLSLDGAGLLDVGCGRADLLDHLADRGVTPGRYVGLEAVGPLADAARGRVGTGGEVVTGDFVADPSCLRVGADVVAVSGSLNTLAPAEFRAAVPALIGAAGVGLVFNFLCSPARAANAYLSWHGASDVLALVREIAPAGSRVALLDDYLDGDATVAVRLARRPV